MGLPAIKVCRDADELARQAAAMIAESARNSIRQRGRFTLCVAGGGTPKKTYALLASGQDNVHVDWPRTFLFFGDERCVPHDDERSNFNMVRQSLLAHAPVPETNVFPVPTQFASAQDCAEKYAGTIADFFAAPLGGAPPVFDLILLGLGDDGHTASLFPGAPALAVTNTWATFSPPGVLPPAVDRVTLTYPVLNAARQVLFLVCGSNKAAALRDILEGAADPAHRPAAGVRPQHGEVTWLVDQAAALYSRI